MRYATLRTLIVAMTALVCVVNTGHAQQFKLTFEEVTQTADLIFIGTVSGCSCRLNASNTMIFTDVAFDDIVIVSATGRSLQQDSSVIHLTYAGGRVGDMRVTVSDAPLFETSRRYLICMRDDGRTYGNPIMGGYQGQFEVLAGDGVQEQFVLTSGRKAILHASASGIVSSDRRVSSLRGGVLTYEERQEGVDAMLFTQLPTPGDDVSTQTRGGNALAVSSAPMRLGEFVEYIRTTALHTPITKKILTLDGQEPAPAPIINSGTTSEQHLVPMAAPQTHSQSIGPPVSASVLGGAVGTCGYQKLPLVMEQEPTYMPNFSVNNDCMWVWNQYMDIYRGAVYASGFGKNSTNELCGLVDDATMNSKYGFHWNGFLGMTVIYMGAFQFDCGQFSETDVMFNPDKTWTNDQQRSLITSDVLARPVIMHELGHTWGEEDGKTYTPETYDYDVATVMHAYYSNIIEDGWGIHAADAQLLRKQYQNQTGVLSIRDIGVESYYASNGLKNSTPDQLSYNPGQSITLSNVLVENISSSAIADVRLRFFLSRDRNISLDDIQIGPYWSWASFPGESSNITNYTMYIPFDVPVGNYYIGAMVTINGYAADDFSYNNTTSFYDRIVIANPPPLITSLSPSGAAAAGAAFTLTVNGANFFSYPQVRWNGADRPTTGVSSTQVTAQISAADIATAGTATVTVYCSPGGLTATGAVFTTTNPIPSITSLSQYIAAAGTGEFKLTVTGSNFIGSTRVRWNGSDLKTTYGSSTELTGLVGATELAAGGYATVTVYTPAPGGGSNGNATFTVTNPAPGIASLSPSGTPAGHASFTLTVTGKNFVTTSIVRWNGADRKTTVAGPTEAMASISATDVGTFGTANVSVVNPAPGGGTTAAIPFTIAVAIPDKVTLITPVNGARIGADSVRFVWHRSSPSVTSYEVQLAGDTTVVGVSADTSMMLKVRAGAAEKTFSWAVRAKNASGFGVLSDLWALVRLTTDIAHIDTAPADAAMVSNYPNPFNPSTTFSLRIPSRALVLLTVFDVLGKEVSVVLSEELEAGEYSRQWTAAGLHSGMYFYRLQAGAFSATRKLLLLR